MSAAGTTSRFIDVFEHARLVATVEGALPLARMARLLPSLAASDGELTYVYQGHLDALGRPAGQLSFRARVSLTCDRCGMPLMRELAGEAHYYFVRSEAELARIPVDESVEEPLLGSPRFDLHELLEDEAILALPISPRHADCASRVDEAGEPTGTADAPGHDRPHPFAELARLKSRRQ